MHALRLSTVGLAFSLMACTALMACTGDPASMTTVTSTGISMGTGISSGPSDSTDDGDETTSDSDSMGSGPKLDIMGDETGEIPCGEGEFCDCEIPPHAPCDNNGTLAQAMGLNCPGETPVSFNTMGAAAAMGTRSNFGNANAFPAQEGSVFAVIGSGRVDELPDSSGLGCSSDLGSYDPGSLPSPINPNADDSGTIAGQLAGTVNDYTELRIIATAPNTVNSFSYNLAYFSIEYPVYYLSVYNDMYIGWLNSEEWTGNISFDENGEPISLNAGFLDYRDAAAANDPMCAAGCTAPELHGTCMEGHAGTKWLTTNAGVVPGETFTLVLAIFDMSDSVLDSYAFIDNFQWGCDGEQPPSTTPIE